MPTFDQPSSSSSVPVWAHTDSHDEMDGTGEDDQDNVFRDMSFDDTMEELIARFMVNLPKEETTLVRLYWQAEQAHWFYEDYLRPLNPFLPSLSQKHFTHLIIASSPIYANLTDANGDKIDYDAIWLEYMAYKRMVPTCGVILVNRQGTKVILVRGWKSSAGWSFPRGKINEKESEEACAVRELEEETGFDCSRLINAKAKYQTYVNAQSVTMFFVTGVDENTHFAPKTRNEIGGIEWVKLKDLPTWNRKRTKSAPKGSKKFYNVTPFVVPLKRYLKDNGLLDSGKADNHADHASPFPRPPLSGHDDSQIGPIYPSRNPPPVSSHPITQPTTTLDQLFAKFVHKQEEDLQTGGITVGTDNKAGLERLFGNLTVDEEKQQHGENSSSEDDALARLLGAIGPSATPAPAQSHQAPPSAGKAKLLAVLNQKEPPPPTPKAMPDPTTPRQPQQVVSKPHQASLLAVLSSQSHSHASTPSSDSTIHGKPTSLPTSPRPISPTETERKSKQRALLEMTIAGIGLDSSSSRPPDNGPYGHGHSQTAEHSLQASGAAPMAYSGNPTRVTPPQTYNGQQYRPPAPHSMTHPPSFAPPSGTYYSHAPQPPPQQSGHGGGPSPGRSRGAPPPYESHFGSPPSSTGQSRPPPHAVTSQPAPPPAVDYSHHQHAPIGYHARPAQPGPGVAQGYRPHHVTHQPYMPNVQPQQFGPPLQQPAPFFNQGATNYQPPPPRPVPQQQYPAPPMPPPQSYAGTSHAPFNPANNTNHSGPMHQPVPKNGQQTGMLLAMLNEGRGR